ncbi:MAG: NAD-dependent epimerase/dehydratase family protein [Candidatus Rokubacteria bacterium]|nr:NAD-dependent epimerase/dehydratase family protein [Candidatus Rokubacteria bacterium]
MSHWTFPRSCICLSRGTGSRRGTVSRCLGARVGSPGARSSRPYGGTGRAVSERGDALSRTVGDRRVLVTGGAGYIGSILVPQLLEAGYAVTVLDNFMYGQASLLDYCHHPVLQIIRGDARDRARVQPLVRDADVLLPLACLTGAPACDKDPVAARTVNLEAVEMLLALKRPEQVVVFPNTNSGYGIGAQDGVCTEESPLNPVSEYGRLKVAAEQRVLQHDNAIVLRLATVFGVSPRMRLDLLVNDFTYRAVTDGFVVLFEAHFRRNYIHVRDVARAFLHCLNNVDRMKGQAYNVGLSDANLSKRALCEEIKKQVPRFYFVEADIGQDPDRRDYIVSNERIERTGFKPTVSLQQGIAELIRGYAVVRRAGYGNV